MTCAVGAGLLLNSACSLMPRKTRRYDPSMDDGENLDMPEITGAELPNGVIFALEAALPLQKINTPIVVRMAQFEGSSRRAVVVRDDAGVLRGFIAECPDFGDRIRPRRTGHKHYWQSVWHGARFSWDGRVNMRGPARNPLRAVTVYEFAGQVSVVFDSA